MNYDKEEIWKDIKNYTGSYQISNLGRVKSLNFNNTKQEKILKQSPQPNLYLRVRLTKNGISKNYLVHRLVGETFVLNPKNKPHINHIDGNRTNNDINNLEWVTPSENNIHRYRKHTYQTNEEKKLWKKEYREKNAKKIKEQDKKYKEQNREKIKKYKKEYRKKNKDIINAKQREYYNKRKKSQNIYVG